MEDVRTATRLLSKGNFTCTLDLKDAYFVISVYPAHRKYLKFRFNKCLNQFTCMPFGLTSAPFYIQQVTQTCSEMLKVRRLRLC